MGAAEAASWIFGVYFFGGIASILVALVQRQPISFSWSIPGTALVLSALQGHTLAELVGAYLVVGAAVVAVSLSGVVGRIVELLPFPIVVAMIAGILMRFAIAVVGAGQAQPAIVMAALVGYFLAARLVPRLPGVLAALAFGAVAAVAASRVQAAPGAFSFVLPGLVWPAWSTSAIVSVAVPLALLIVCAENVKGVGILMAAGYRPPANSMLLASGIGTLACALFGGHNLNVAGPMTAICSSAEAGRPEGRYAASVVQGCVYVLFGLAASVAVGLVPALPSELIATVAGLAMIIPLIAALGAAFGAQRFQVGAIVSFVVGSTDLSILGIGSPLWALAFGIAASWLVEPKSFRRPANAGIA
jgi:benzoate membrane transport protein